VESSILIASVKWHADSEDVPATGLRTGTSDEHFSPIEAANAQRGWKAQPDGGEIIEGGVPEMANSSFSPDSLRLRTDRKRPHEYGWAG
jgi:hypothetical protein